MHVQTHASVCDKMTILQQFSQTCVCVCGVGDFSIFLFITLLMAFFNPSSFFLAPPASLSTITLVFPNDSRFPVPPPSLPVSLSLPSSLFKWILQSVAVKLVGLLER